jgi:nitric oxide reductase NorD protein
MSNIEAKLRRLKPEVADQFSRVEARLNKLLSNEELAGWGELCWVLADAGWHGWEATNDYVNLSTDLARKPQRLLEVGEYCTTLVGTSFEPGRTYLRGISQLIECDDFRQLPLIDETGKAILDRFQHASNLHTAFFKSAFTVAQDQELEMLAAWCRFASLNAGLERAALLEFLNLSFSAPQQNWLILADIAICHRDNAVAYLAFAAKIRHTVSPVEQPLATLALRYSEQQQSIEAWLDALSKVLPILTEPQARALVEFSGLLSSVAEATAFTESAPRLPLDRHEVLSGWLESRPFDASDKVILAYIKLESAVSEQRLQELLGQVQLHEEQRWLQLFAEGMSGTRLKIEVGEGLPTSDGQVIRLPSVVDLFKDRADNFRWLRTALIHQLGCYEFGTFEFKRGNSFIAFENQFRSYEQPMLAESLFTICEAARVDWQLAARYRGAAVEIATIKAAAAKGRHFQGFSARRQLLESMVLHSLDVKPLAANTLDDSIKALVPEIFELLDQLKMNNANVETSMDVMAECYALVSGTPIDIKPLEPVLYRGIIPFDDASINLQLNAIEDMDADFTDSDEDGVQMTGATDDANPNIDELQAGDVDNPTAVISADEDMIVPDDLNHLDDPAGLQKMERLKQERKEPAEITFRYDEWDYAIEDYRRRWCTLYEFRKLEQDVDFVPNTLSEHRALATKVRRQLNMLRPELLRKVKGVADGEELDLERAIEAVVDRKSGVSPSENIYIQRQRKERDVAALFLLDMSASTDDLIEPEPTVYVENDDEYLHGFANIGDEPAKERGKTILDLEKESVVLMAEALEGLGDSYAVCGFSGYGRDRIEFYVCKDFDEPYNYHAKGNIGGIKPCRSTRMGPAIRHASKMLAATESRIKALIIISDGYPQDYDYGQDRNSKDYGIKDTTQALTEASQQGVQSFCLTVDPSGHDYLREMCPDQQYMVIQDITQLPDELSKVYRGLTS